MENVSNYELSSYVYFYNAQDMMISNFERTCRETMLPVHRFCSAVVLCELRKIRNLLGYETLNRDPKESCLLSTEPPC